MTPQIIGAGLGRTGTTSLKAALETLLGGPCYHMFEVFPRPQDVPVWHAAVRGRMPDWRAFLDGFAAAVDWPAAAFWQELAAAFPDASIVLSTRASEDWWRSASSTIFPALRRAEGEWRQMMDALMDARFVGDLGDKAACIAAYEAHNARVRRSVPSARLVDWQVGDGWAPLCRALGVPIPVADFPHANSTADFHARRRDAAGGT